MYALEISTIRNGILKHKTRGPAPISVEFSTLGVVFSTPTVLQVDKGSTTLCYDGASRKHASIEGPREESGSRAMND